MVELEQLLNESRIACQEALPTKKRVLERVSELLTLDLSDLNPQELFEAFIAREKLGSTSIGHGVALPHVRHEAILEPRAAFIQLSKPVEFDTINKTEADLIFALLVQVKHIVSTYKFLHNVLPYLRKALPDNHYDAHKILRLC